MCVKLFNNYSPLVEIPSGVPHGSVLGPYLFAVFMGRIDFSADNILCIKYADDMTILETFPYNCDFPTTLDTSEAVFTSNGLYVNRRKCKQFAVCGSQLCMQDIDTGFY